ncbi:hypothetical protein SDJN02_00383, partial [Cucurbita argyrosperma subsp. argyrosperma]
DIKLDDLETNTLFLSIGGGFVLGVGIKLLPLLEEWGYRGYGHSFNWFRSSFPLTKQHHRLSSQYVILGHDFMVVLVYQYAMELFHL